MNKNWILGAAFAAFLAAPAAFAQDEPPKGPPPPGAQHARMMEKIDTDGDGKISKAEFTAAQEERFTKTDTDGDGFLSPEEMKASWEKMHEMRGMKREGRPGGPPPMPQEDMPDHPADE